MKNEYDVTGMTCGHCENHVREELANVKGVEGVDVSHVTGKLVVTGEVNDADVIAAVDEAGYAAKRA